MCVIQREADLYVYKNGMIYLYWVPVCPSHCKYLKEIKYQSRTENHKIIVESQLVRCKIFVVDFIFVTNLFSIALAVAVYLSSTSLGTN